jgi:hypothetical protein
MACGSDSDYILGRNRKLRATEVHMKETLRNELKCRAKKVRITKEKCYRLDYQVATAGKLQLFFLLMPLSVTQKSLFSILPSLKDIPCMFK